MFLSVMRAEFFLESLYYCSKKNCLLQETIIWTSVGINFLSFFRYFQATETVKGARLITFMDTKVLEIVKSQ